jgi:hypothetical protein
MAISWIKAKYNSNKAKCAHLYKQINNNLQHKQTRQTAIFRMQLYSTKFLPKHFEKIISQDNMNLLLYLCKRIHFFERKVESLEV